MKAIFTICSNNYLAKATVLANSVSLHQPNTKFIVVLCDHKDARIDYNSLPFETIEAIEIEPAIVDMAKRYNVVELNTSIKPKVFEYLFDKKGMEQVIYLDPDIRLFSSINSVFTDLETYNIVLTPHICSPTPLDGKTPAENMFNNFGNYNLGFIGVKNSAESLRFLSWWYDHTYNQCYVDIYNGIFVDQLPINHAPIFFEDVYVSKDLGKNMAPWNLHERFLEKSGDQYLVNKKSPLVFYHFSNFKTGQLELPLKYYNRFKLSDRPDLREIYQLYSDEIVNARDSFFETIACSFALSATSGKKKNAFKRFTDKVFKR